MKTKTLIASFAVASLAVAQPAAAATRSFESLPSNGLQTADAERTASPLADAEAVRGKPVIVILLVAGVLAALLLALGSSNDTNGPVQSPG
jgi:hypothetical protein